MSEEQGGLVNRYSKKTGLAVEGRNNMLLVVSKGGGSEGLENQLQWVD